MGFYTRMNEAIKAFRGKGDRPSDEQIKKTSGEGFEDIGAIGFGINSISSFNLFYKSYIDKSHKNEVERIQSYRRMTAAPEIADVIEDAVNESTQTDTDGYIIQFEIFDDTISNKEQAMKVLNEEFYSLFYNKLNLEENLWDWYYTYFVDGRLYLENIININNQKAGIVNAKKLPSETMDYLWNPRTGRIDCYFQYLKENVRRPITREDAEKNPDVIVFEPQQITFVPYQYGLNKQVLLGYLEKSRIPYNILKLLETSLVIYRIVRAPERLVFKIDVGNMPRDKGMKFVQKVKEQMNKKTMFDPNTGTLVNTNEVLSILDNYFIPQGENRGSDISSVGGQSGAFRELDDIYYFHKKLYRALKYPVSRVEKHQEGRSDDVLFQGRSFNEITRDEIKWAKFLERQQLKFARALKDLFLLHLELKGLKAQYGLEKDNIQIQFNPPSDYKEQMEQSLLETRHRNYSELAREKEFSKYYLMRKYLDWTDEEIKENVDGFKKDRELGFISAEDPSAW
jgi:hypothetical protein